jgi:hypothetical protein
MFSSQIFMEFPENLFSPDIFPIENPPKISSQMKQNLKQFHYVSPEMIKLLDQDEQDCLHDETTKVTSTRPKAQQMPSSSPPRLSPPSSQSQVEKPSTPSPTGQPIPRLSSSSTSSFVHKIHNSFGSFDVGVEDQQDSNCSSENKLRLQDTSSANQAQRSEQLKKLSTLRDSMSSLQENNLII